VKALELQGLTTKEVGFIEECIKAEALCVAKCAGYAHEAADPELRELCRDAVAGANRHIDELLGLLR